MSLETDLYQSLRGYFSDRVYPLTFPQPVSDATWPSLRYSIISVDPGTDLCGDGGGVTSDTRVQFDIVAKTFAQMRTLRLQVLSELEDFVPPAIYSGEFEEYDADTKTYRASLDYVFYPSST